MADTTEINTTNRHLVATRAGQIVVLSPPLAPMSTREALVFAAWIVVMVGDDEAWERTLAAVHNT